MLVALRVQCGRCKGTKVGSGDREVGNLEARIVGRHRGRYQRGKRLYWSVSYSQLVPGPTYSIVLAHVVALVEELLVGVQLLEIAVRVAMHLYAVGRRRHALVRAVYLILRLGEGWRARLAVLRHAIVEEAVIGRLRHAADAHILDLLPAVCAIPVVLGKLRGELALEMVDVERLGQIGQLAAISCGSIVAVAVDAEM
jgi:hypothetical protein